MPTRYDPDNDMFEYTDDVDNLDESPTESTPEETEIVTAAETDIFRIGPERRNDERRIRHAMLHGDITACQLVPWGSNYTFAVAIEQSDGQSFIGIYKPERGESPLWDFPHGTLYHREYAAYILSRLLGWQFIPPTVIRSGPHGIGTVQLYIEPEQMPVGDSGWLSFSDQLEEMVLFDVITNNADRKPSHYFVGRYHPRIWGIDHGLTFNIVPKLRTVIWDFCGTPIREELVDQLRKLLDARPRMTGTLAPFLEEIEIEFMMQRIEALVDSRQHPYFSPRRNLPFGW